MSAGELNVLFFLSLISHHSHRVRRKQSHTKTMTHTLSVTMGVTCHPPFSPRMNSWRAEERKRKRRGGEVRIMVFFFSFPFVSFFLSLSFILSFCLSFSVYLEDLYHSMERAEERAELCRTRAGLSLHSHLACV